MWDLIEHIDRVAGIHNSLRIGTGVTLRDVQAVSVESCEPKGGTSASARTLSRSLGAARCPA